MNINDENDDKSIVITVLEPHHSELFNIFVATDKHGTFSVTCPVAIGLAAPT